MQHQDLVSVCAVPSEAQAQHHVKEVPRETVLKGSSRGQKTSRLTVKATKQRDRVHSFCNEALARKKFQQGGRLSLSAGSILICRLFSVEFTCKQGRERQGSRI